MNDNWRHSGPPPGHGPGGNDAYKDSTGGYSPYGGYGALGSGYGPGQPHPGGPYPGGGYPGGPYREQRSASSAITALVVSLVLVLTCCGFLGIVGTVFSALAISEKSDPDKYQRYTRVAWISNGVILALVALILTYIVIAVASDM
ncbi:hypothetical protein [Nocardiopsis synnemataformans]|uniref:hypothetical protein n=1 Tax=Nocardiopsis synnemataformans TaxID=61305 RepID=UPI003EBD30FA